MRVNVLPNGRLVLPIALRRRLGIERGGELIAEPDGDAVRLTTPDRSLDEAGSLFRSYLQDDASVADEVIAERRAENAADAGSASRTKPAARPGPATD